MLSGGDHGTLSGLFARTGTASADFPSAVNPVRHDRAHYQPPRRSEVDLHVFESHHNDATGAPAIHPAILLKVIVCYTEGLIGKSMFAVDGCKIVSNCAKEWSGAEKIEASVRLLLASQAWRPTVSHLWT
jgi:hypothetical protein